MEKTYSVKEETISKLLNTLEGFTQRMKSFNEKYGRPYKYTIDIKEKSDKDGFVADINIKRNG